mmetsp:Transcript_42821/g.99449  ORF Transcript_42821/g.99449 Transcript_42821/m.99449 type:complete len:216 (-) Transcript_42821:121-768(-)
MRRTSVFSCFSIFCATTSATPNRAAAAGMLARVSGEEKMGNSPSATLKVPTMARSVVADAPRRSWAEGEGIVAGTIGGGGAKTSSAVAPREAWRLVLVEEGVPRPPNCAIAARRRTPARPAPQSLLKVWSCPFRNRDLPATGPPALAFRTAHAPGADAERDSWGRGRLPPAANPSSLSQRLDAPLRGRLPPPKARDPVRRGRDDAEELREMGEAT